MIESIAMAGLVWLFHAVFAGLPIIVAYQSGLACRWPFCLALLTVPFWALLPAQAIWPTGGMSSYLLRLFILTVVVFIAELIEVSPSMRTAPTWRHFVLLAVATLAVIPIQLVVPSLHD